VQLSYYVAKPMNVCHDIHYRHSPSNRNPPHPQGSSVSTYNNTIWLCY
jgi:hypothetical protein